MRGIYMQMRKHFAPHSPATVTSSSAAQHFTISPFHRPTSESTKIAGSLDRWCWSASFPACAFIFRFASERGVREI